MTRGRAVLLALAVAVAPLLQLLGFALHPVLPEKAAGQVETVAADPARWVVVHLAAAAAAAAFVVVGPALAGLVRGRGSRPATVGAALLAVGGALLAMAFGAEAHLLPLAADPSVDREAAAALVALEEGSPVMVLLLAGMPLAGVGQVLLSVGLLRSRVVPAWMPSLVLVGVLASLAAPPGATAGPFLLAPAVIGYAALAVRVARRPLTGSPDRQERTAPEQVLVPA